MTSFNKLPLASGGRCFAARATAYQTHFVSKPKSRPVPPSRKAGWAPNHEARHQPRDVGDLIDLHLEELKELGRSFGRSWGQIVFAPGGPR